MGGPPKTVTFDEPINLTFDATKAGAPKTVTFDTTDQSNPNLQFPGPTGIYAKSPLYENSPQQIEDEYQKLGPLTRFNVGINESLGIPKSVSRSPSEALTGVGMAVKDPKLLLESLGEMYNSATKAQTDLLDRAFQMQELEGIKNKQHAFALRVYAAIPLIGPNLAAIVDRWTSGDRAGALGNLTGIAAQMNAPVLTGKAAEVIPSSVAEVKALPGQVKAAVEAIPGKVQGAIQSVKEGAPVMARRTLQNITGAGPEATSEKMLTDYRKKLAKAQTDLEEQQVEHGKAVEDVNNFNSALDQTLDLRQRLTNELEQKTKAYFDKEANVKDAAKKAENAAWQPWHNKAQGVAIDTSPLMAAIDKTGTNAAEVRNVLRQLTPEPSEAASTSLFAQDRAAVMKAQGFTGDYWDLPPNMRAQIDSITASNGLTPDPIDLDPAGGAKAITLEDLHTAKSILGYKIARGEYPGHIAGDMKRIYNTLSQMEANESSNIGALNDLNIAKAETAKYQHAFGRVKPTRTTQDLVRQKKANPEALEAEQEEANLQAASQYDPTLATDYREVQSLRNRLKDIPEEKKLRAQRKEPPEEPQLAKTLHPTLEELQQEKASNIASSSTSLKRMTRFDWIMLGTHTLRADLDKLLVGGLALEKTMGVILSKRSVIDIISQPLPEEIAAFKALPKDAQITVRAKLQDFVTQGKRIGTITKVNPETAALLSGNVVTKKSPGEQRKELDKIRKQYEAVPNSNPNLAGSSTQ